jgi:peptidoglycan/LPS O-acetylase OafA/YrhL
VHRNNFGFLRLLFATLVIVSHSAELIDGNRSREPLTNLFGVLTFGELAVDGFFLISGYLVVQSFERSDSTINYLMKRIRRIYPGFLVAYFVCVFVIAPWVGNDLTSMNFGDLASVIRKALFLREPPKIYGFAGLPHPPLNGSMWTIHEEFRCYLLVILFGLIGIYRNKWILAVMTTALLALMEMKFDPSFSAVVGDPHSIVRFLGIFCVGSLFYRLQNSIPYHTAIAAAVTVALAFCLYNSIIAESAFAVLGGYLLFWFALHLKSTVLQTINGEDDISYGVYLYAWPVQNAIIFFFGIKSPWTLTLLTLPLVYIIGYASWRLFERRFVRNKMIASPATPKP